MFLLNQLTLHSIKGLQILLASMFWGLKCFSRPKEDQQMKKGRQSGRPTPWVKSACDLTLVAISIAFIYWIFLGKH